MSKMVRLATLILGLVFITHIPTLSVTAGFAAEPILTVSSLTKEANVYYDHCLASAITQGKIDPDMGLPRGKMCFDLGEVLCASMGYKTSVILQTEAMMPPPAEYTADKHDLTHCMDFEVAEVKKITEKVTAANGTYTDEIGSLERN